MVSKITKRSQKTPAKSPLCRRTPPPASVIRRSIRSCRRKLLRMLARLAVLSPSSSTPESLGFTRIKPVDTAQNPLPPPFSPSKMTLFLDLDETLVHSKTDPAPVNYDFVVFPKIDGQTVPFYVLKRPGVDQFLKMAATKFEIVVFTAGLEEYASRVLDLLDPKGEVIAHRLYRDSCRQIEGKYVKDLSDLGRDLGRVAIVDDNPMSFSLQPENAVRVKPFVSDPEDEELKRVMEFLDVAVKFEDVRDAVKVFCGETRGEACGLI